MDKRSVAIEINGRTYDAEIEPRLLLSDFIREQARLTGTHVGCEHGVCGACTIQIDGEPMRSCLMLAVQANGCDVRTVEGLSDGLPDDELGLLQQAFHDKHALQCGFCTPGFLLSVEPLLIAPDDPTDEHIRSALAGNLCRCTGYQNIVDAVRQAVETVRDRRATSTDLSTEQATAES